MTDKKGTRSRYLLLSIGVVLFFKYPVDGKAIFYLVFAQVCKSFRDYRTELNTELKEDKQTYFERCCEIQKIDKI